MKRTLTMPILAMLATAASGPVPAQTDETPVEAEAAIAELGGQDGTEDMACTVSAEWVVCTGVAVGACLAVGWQISHDGERCRKRLAQ